MTTLNKIIEKCLILTLVCCFGLVSVYIPHNLNDIEEVEAGGPATGGASEPTQILNMGQLLGVNAATTVSASADGVTAAMVSSSFVLDNVLDGIAWSLAKSVLSQMTSSMVNWVNSGFEGSPAFITDFKGFVTEIADKQFGQYLEELGGAFSFICAPFKLDVRLALAVTYDYQRVNGQAPGKSKSCTLSGAIENVDKFIEGTEKFVETGGWNSFFAITQNPSASTPLGGVLSAQAEMSARIVNARGEELRLLDYGSGFLSSKVCEAVGGSTASSTRKNCTITTPGKVINEALTFQTSTGPQSLISADEINELVSALFAQITQQAITGAAGLLGLSGGSGYVYSGTAYTTELGSDPSSLNPTVLKKLIEDSIALEEEYETIILTYRPLFEAFALDVVNNNEQQRAQASDILVEMGETLVEIDENLSDPLYPTPSSLYDLLNRFNAMMLVGVNPKTMQQITNEYSNNLRLHPAPEIDGKEIAWSAFLR
jgi:hypothetical protein